ncbi:MAG: DUF2807 domain-containing protein [Bacteroidales bacterium]|nr:DUF2807 domain-containing protein [Bacteroidales bacterium]
MSYKKPIPFFLLNIAVLMVLTGCDGIFTKEEEETYRKEINLTSFRYISIHGIYNLILKQDTVHKLTIEGMNDAINDIGACVMNDTLVIRDAHRDLFRIEEKVTLYLQFSDIAYLCTYNPVKVINQDTLRLDRFYYYPIGEIGEACLTVECNFFGLDNSANTLGRFIIRGSAHTARFYNRYGSSIYADDLESQIVYVFNESIGDVYVNAAELLQVYIWGKGNIYYSGNPVVEIVEKRDSGQVLKP